MFFLCLYILVLSSFSFQLYIFFCGPLRSCMVLVYCLLVESCVLYGHMIFDMFIYMGLFDPTYSNIVLHDSECSHNFFELSSNAQYVLVWSWQIFIFHYPLRGSRSKKMLKYISVWHWPPWANSPHQWPPWKYDITYFDHNVANSRGQHRHKGTQTEHRDLDIMTTALLSDALVKNCRFSWSGFSSVISTWIWML